ncbi:MAG: mannosyltransferase family protein [Armatimonadota bacterium]|nr:mannosyltransferase family protein [Armatimonadota bacterium]
MAPRPAHAPVLNGSRFFWQALWMAVGVRAGLFLVAYVTGVVYIGREHASLWQVLNETLNRWDAPHYLRIAEVGYLSHGEDRLFLVFFPLFPALIRLVNHIVGNVLISGLVVSFAAAVAAGYCLQVLVRLDADDEEATRSLWYLSLFPTAYFLAVPYSEALFLALILASFLAARRQQWLFAGAFGLLACATRLQGLALVPALVVEAFGRTRGHVRSGARQAWPIVLAPLGFALYLGINWLVAGDPLAWLTIQGEHWQHLPTLPWRAFLHSLGRVVGDPPGPYRTVVHEAMVASASFAVILLVASARWLRPSYQVYAWTGVALLTGATFQISLPRYLLAVFPLFIVLARWGHRPAVHHAAVAASAVLMGGLFIMYASRWGF